MIPFSWQSACRWLSHNPSGRLPLHSTRTTDSFPAKDITSLGRYQIILLGDSGIQVLVACPRPLSNDAQPGLEHTTCESQVRSPANSTHYMDKNNTILRRQTYASCFAVFALPACLPPLLVPRAPLDVPAPLPRPPRPLATPTVWPLPLPLCPRSTVSRPLGPDVWPVDCSMAAFIRSCSADRQRQYDDNENIAIFIIMSAIYSSCFFCRI